MSEKRGWIAVVWVLLGVAAATACSGDEQASQGSASSAGRGGEPGAAAGAGAEAGAMAEEGAGGGVGGEASAVRGGAGGESPGGGGEAGGESPVGGGGAGGESPVGGRGGGGETAAGAGHGGADAAGGAGGAAGGYVPGLCQQGGEPIEPGVLPACTVGNDDGACIECLKTHSCDEYRVCFGTEPGTACGRGPDEASLGQFECIVACFADGADSALDGAQLLEDCSEQCSRCPSGLVNDETSALVEAANDPQKCQAQCFPFD